MTTPPKEENAFEKLYLQQRKKSSILLVAVIVLAISTVGSMAWGLGKHTNTPTDLPGGGAIERSFGGQGGRGGMRGMDVTRFFNDDKSVNTEEVKNFVGRMPSRTGSNPGGSFLDRFKDSIKQSVEAGTITQAQADALNKAIETESNK